MNNVMKITVISVREDSLVYDIASERIKNEGDTWLQVSLYELKITCN
ncbi:hypothetical protein HGQ85_04870 [Clostridioides difficile]|nr:hypothetical protein [Clostridioides difficile]